LMQMLGADASEILLSGWKSHSPNMRRTILDVLLQSRSSTLQLLQAAEKEPAIAKTFSATHIATVTRHANLQIKKLGDNIFGQRIASNRMALIEDYQESLDLTGDPQAGRNHFTALCSTCHKMGEIGFAVGPDLTSLTDKSPGSMLIATLDPNRAVEDKYTQYTATTLDGRMFSGIMADETTTSLTLVTTGGLTQSLVRQNLKSLESSGISLMPEGLEAGLDHQKMADLIAFINASDESLKIRADINGSIGLTASRGTASGPSVFYNPETENFEWVADTDTLEWTVYDLKIGYYDIFSHAALAVEYEGRPFTLSINDTFVTGAVPYTGGIDRFRMRKFGNIQIEEDIPKAVFKLQHSLDGPQLSLKELRLIPVP
ncbi:MAG: c-type cytochrome, partial [Verrucomicrobia bacterium]|nr:c-type cytochrome [Verrucomicrobiota bacterium]